MLSSDHSQRVVAELAALAHRAPQVPEWYDTATSDRVAERLSYAQTGKRVLISTDTGIGKTIVAQRFAAEHTNTWMATMAPSTSGLRAMAIEVAEAIGLGEIIGRTKTISRQIIAHLEGKEGLLIVDEAHQLTYEALKELRSWHDFTGVGIAFLSSVTEPTRHKSLLDSLSTYVSDEYCQYTVLPGDINAALDAWGVTDQAQRSLLTHVGHLPGALRAVTQTLKLALVAASQSGHALTLDYLHQAVRARGVKLGTL